MIRLPRHKKFLVPMAITAIVLFMAIGSTSRAGTSPENPIAKVKAIRFGTHADFSRLVVDLDRKVTFDPKELAKNRLMQIVFHSVEGLARSDWGYRDKLIAKIESTMERESNDWKISISYLPAEIRWKSFYLDNPPRWVFDFSQGKKTVTRESTKKGSDVSRNKMSPAPPETDSAPLEKERTTAKNIGAENAVSEVKEVPRAPASPSNNGDIPKPLPDGQGQNSSETTREKESHLALSEKENKNLAVSSPTINNATNLETSRPDASDVVKGNEETQMALYTQAKSLQDAGMFLDAGVMYKRFIESFPQSKLALQAHLHLADIHYYFNDLDDSLVEYQLVYKSAADFDDKELRRISFRLAELLYMKDYSNAEGRALYLSSFRKWPDFSDLPPQSIYNLGDIFHQKGDYAKAREIFFLFINVYSKEEVTPLVLQKIGDSYIKQGLQEAAEKTYQEIVKRYPGNPIAALGKLRLAEIAYEYKKTSSNPLKMFQEVEAVAPYSPLAEIALQKQGIILAEEKKYIQALETFKELFKRFPKTMSSNENKAVLSDTLKNIIGTLMEEKKYYDLLEVYEKHQDIWALINKDTFYSAITESCFELGILDYAEKILRKLLQESGLRKDWVYLKLAEIELEKANYQGVIDALKPLQATNSGSPWLPKAYYLRAEAFFRQNMYNEAVPLYQRSIDMGLRAPLKALAFYRMGLSLVEVKNWSAGSEAFQNAIREVVGNSGEKEFPYLSNTYLALADSLLVQGKKDQTRQVLKEANQFFSQQEMTPQFTYRLGVLGKEIDGKKEARKIFNQLAESKNKGFWAKAAALELGKMAWQERIEKDLEKLSLQLQESRLN